MGRPTVGSEQHKHLFCRSFIDTHDPYDPSDLVFPEIDSSSRERLASLPIWDEAVNTERETAGTVQRMAEVEPDPLVREAIALQGFEESRHAALLHLLTERYGIAVRRRAFDGTGDHPEWAFTRTGYGECFDAFFAFGLFALARESGFFPQPLVTLFDRVMQEEARHVLFFANWVAYRRASLPLWSRPGLDVRRALAVSLQMISRIRTGLDLGGNTQDNFTMKSHAMLGDFSIRHFLEVCLRENERRLGLYDAVLLRPCFAPGLARAALRLLPRKS